MQIALGKMGKESIKRKIQELKVDSIPIDVALGARDLIRDFTLDQVRMVSAGGATFYIWVNIYQNSIYRTMFLSISLKLMIGTFVFCQVRGLTEEIEKRNAEIVHTVRPRTSKRRKERTSIA